jgi:hypothetical protein
MPVNHSFHQPIVTPQIHIALLIVQDVVLIPHYGASYFLVPLVHCARLGGGPEDIERLQYIS